MPEVWSWVYVRRQNCHLVHHVGVRLLRVAHPFYDRRVNVHRTFAVGERNLLLRNECRILLVRAFKHGSFNVGAGHGNDNRSLE